MADETINVLTLGLGGVDVDTDPLLTADNAYRQAQNATFDPTTKRAGALIKRPGLDRFNSVPMSGAVLGGIEAPFAGTAGAPASGGGGGGNPGDTGGATDGQPTVSGGYGVGPGGNQVGGSAGTTTGSTIGASIFSPPAPGPYIIIGRDEQAGTGASAFGRGWYVINKGFQNTATLISGSPRNINTPPGNGYLMAIGGQPTTVGYSRGLIGQTCNHPGAGSVTEGLCARPNGVLFYPQACNPNGQIFGIGNGPTGGISGATQFPFIRRTDGQTDVAVCSIPPNPKLMNGAVSTTLSSSITSGTTSLPVISTVGFPVGGGVVQATFINATGTYNPTLAYANEVTGAHLNLVGQVGGQIATWTTGSLVLINHGMQVVGMGTRYGDGSSIYIEVLDRVAATGSADTTINYAGRILKMNTATYGLTEVFNTLNNNYNAISPGWPYPFLSGLGSEAWFGSDTVSSSGGAGVYSLVKNPAFANGYANWTGYFTPQANDVTCMAEYSGALFAGYSSLVSGSFAVINGNPSVNGGTGSLPGNPLLVGSGGTAQAGNHFVSMAIFLGKLYVSYFNPTQASKIYSFDGTTWATVYTEGGVKIPFNLQLDNDGDILYAYGGIYGGTPKFMTSIDGTTWVDKTANFPTTNNSTPTNVFGAFSG